eukprot:1744087-Alexandrium_andersonii.AAC.1
MSASLVGSEMCIRDSNQPPRQVREREAAQKARPVLGKRATASDSVGRTCLLYTSDAADDM